MSSRRDPSPPTVAYYKKWAKKHNERGEKSEAFFSLTQAFNHLENAAFAEAEVSDALLEVLCRLVERCELNGRFPELTKQAHDAIAKARELREIK